MLLRGYGLLHPRVVGLIVSMVVLVADGAVAQARTGAVIGRIADDRGEPIIGATVQLTEIARVTRTGGDGTYRLAEVPAGAYRLVVRAIGWSGTERAVVVEGGKTITLDLSLPSRPALLSEIVVSVSREAQSRAEATAAVGVLDHDELTRTKARHPADLLNRVPGAWVANLSGEGHFTAIRQPMTTKPVYAFLEDGIPTRSTGFFNHNGLYEINLPMAERVEVIKGPGSALYGSDAVGGVINAYTRAPSATPSVELFAEGGRHGYARALLTGSRGWGNDAVRADLNLTRSDGFRPDASYQRQTGTVRWDRAMGATRLKTVVTWSHIDQPGDGGNSVSEEQFHAGDLTNTTPVAFREVIAVRASSAVEYRRGLTLMTATLYGRSNTMDLLPSWQLGFDPQVWRLEHRSLGAATRFRRTLPAWRLDASLGLDAEVSPGRHRETRIVPEREDGRVVRYTEAELQYDYDVTFWQLAPFAQVDVRPADRLKFEFGFRLDNAGYRYDNRLGELSEGSHRRPASTNVGYRRLSPKLGLAVEMTGGVHAFASYRAAFRAPSEGQLFRQGQAVNTVDLAPVKANNYEAGVRLTATHVTAEATVYQLDISDDILTYFDPANGLRTATNAGATRHRGIEVGLAVRPISPLRVDAAWAFTSQMYRDWRPNPSTDYSGNDIEAAPREIGRIGVTWMPRLLAGGHAGLEWVHQGRYALDPANEEYHDGFNLVHLSAAVPATHGFEVVGRVQNLFDRRFAETASFNAAQGRQYRPGAPRAVSLGLQYRFGGS